MIHQATELWLKLDGPRAARGARADPGRRSAAGVQDAGPGVAHPGPADPVLGRALDADAGRLPGVPRPARAGLGLAVAPVPPARVPARQQAGGHARGASPHPGDPRRARRRSWRARASTTRRCGCWRGAAWRSRPSASSATGAGPTSPTPSVRAAWRDDLPRRRRGTGTCTSWPRSWSTSRTGSGSGAFATSPRSSGSSATRPAPAAAPASSYLKRALDVCCFPELWQVRTEL